MILKYIKKILNHKLNVSGSIKKYANPITNKLFKITGKKCQYLFKFKTNLLF
jgi:hypothetical protein